LQLLVDLEARLIEGVPIVVNLDQLQLRVSGDVTRLLLQKQMIFFFFLVFPVFLSTLFFFFFVMTVAISTMPVISCSSMMVIAPRMMAAS